FRGSGLPCQSVNPCQTVKPFEVPGLPLDALGNRLARASGSCFRGSGPAHQRQARTGRPAPSR
ncbi:MAG: hypothetical protein ACOYMG_23980, partial [Candidatus Methylumidiphilus sp.]